MRIILLLTLLCVYLIQCYAQSSTATVYVQSTTYPGDWGYYSTHFVGVKLNTAGLATIYFVGGDEAYWQFSNSFSDELQSAVFGVNDQQQVTIGATGTYWIYLAEWNTLNNYDYLEIRVVANSFSGTITSLYTGAPSGWGYGWPPMGTHMISSTNSQPPATRPGPISIKSWLIPLLIVIIVGAIAIPTTVYLVRRRNAKKLATMNTDMNTIVHNSELELEAPKENINIQSTQVRV